MCNGLILLKNYWGRIQFTDTKALRFVRLSSYTKTASSRPFSSHAKTAPSRPFSSHAKNAPIPPVRGEVRVKYNVTSLEPLRAEPKNFCYFCLSARQKRSDGRSVFDMCLYRGCVLWLRECAWCEREFVSSCFRSHSFLVRYADTDIRLFSCYFF